MEKCVDGDCVSYVILWDVGVDCLCQCHTCRLQTLSAHTRMCILPSGLLCWTAELVSELARGKGTTRLVLIAGELICTNNASKAVRTSHIMLREGVQETVMEPRFP